MSFASPGYLWLLALTPLAVAAYVWLAAWRRGASERFAPGLPSGRRSGDVSPRLRGLKTLLVLVAVAALPVALARPQIGHDELLVEQAGADIVIALDVSRSMLAEDVEPNRLEAARRATSTLLDRLQGHRVGLVIFARSALLRSPLTTDLTALETLLQSAEQDGSLLAPGSDLGAAIRTATAALADSEAESRVIVLVSDGEDHEGEALAAAREAAQRGVRLFVAGAGTEAGARIPATAPAGAGGAEEEPDSPATVVTALDEGLLRRIAAATPGGDYVPGAELASLGETIDRLDRTSFVAERQRLPVERFQWLVLAALVALAVEALVPERRLSLPRLRLPRGGAPHAAQLGIWIAVVALLAAACGSTANSLIADGNRSYGEASYDDALEAYRRAGSVAPDRTEPHVNAGLALHQLERFDEAAEETARALPVDDSRLAARIHYTLGNHYVRLGRNFDALASYRDALLLDPDHEDAKHNLELVLRLIQDANILGTADEADAGGSSPADTETPSGEGQSGVSDGEGSGDGSLTEATLRSLEEALAGIEEEFTVEEALRALDLVAELGRQRPVAGGSRASGSPDRPDY